MLKPLLQRAIRMLLSLASVVAVTFVAYRLAPVNATTAGLAFLLVVLVIASTWGFPEALLASVTATLTFNFFFFPPIGRLTIADPQNWIALCSFLATALIASRLSAKARRRAQEAIEHQQDVERLYTFSRAILLIGGGEPFPRQLARKLAEIFGLSAVVLFERRTGEFHREGPAEFDGLDEQLREAALQGTSYFDAERQRVITAVRLGSEPIASLALQGAVMADAVLQGIPNLVAIGLERARAQDLAHQVEAARQSEQLRTTGQARSFNAKHSANLSRANFRNQMLESGALHLARSRQDPRRLSRPAESQVGELGRPNHIAGAGSPGCESPVRVMTDEYR